MNEIKSLLKPFAWSLPLIVVFKPSKVKSDWRIPKKLLFIAIFRENFQSPGRAACCYWDGCNRNWFVATGAPPQVTLDTSVSFSLDG